MPVLRTEAIVLHAFDYLESSRILRLMTREAGLRSVLARGARRSKRRFGGGGGTSLDLFTQGHAELHVKPGRELDTLSSFDAVRARVSLAADLGRFTGAGAIAELTLRFARDAADPGLFEAVDQGLDAIAESAPERTRDVTLAAAWRVLAELGVGPAIDNCAECNAQIAASAERLVFSHPAGGVLCARCGRGLGSAGGRMLPASAREALRDWLGGSAHPIVDPQETRAHQRLLREFLREHLHEERPLRAFETWEHETLSGGSEQLAVERGTSGAA